MPFDEEAVAKALRTAGARFAFVHGSRASGTPRPTSDLDVAAWWGMPAPNAWEVRLPAGVDLIVLDRAPLWLAGRIALRGRLLFDDDPSARVAWQADTRTVYLDELPAMEQTYEEYLQAVTDGR
ncbi:MAG: nucleotidyltransferase domain-containing protein [Streptosporangiales bacterium]